MVHETAIIDPGASVGTGSRVWHWAHICGGAKLGRTCRLGKTYLSATEFR